ncbi:MAG TPA: aspartyl/glutamyl-tRNA amidotransferase subunit C [candidate division WWE3 bacterium]|uniref:Aspartyl/glutamyl-tRNA amidotransferase subunit C n=1 Tax=candidate division WWE3 bacterium TaxID=2053526 RepID=A0A7C1HDQ3_UNCKA|nr:aspartyl/glutamyl-tRNA amidotransferase subunit C [candidate division WWE3 bacterium]
MSKKISSMDVAHIAKLTNLTLSDAENEKLSQMLSDTLGHVGILEEIETSSVPETFQVTGLTNVYRDTNFPVTSLTKEEVLQNALIQKNGKIGTKAVFGRE